MPVDGMGSYFDLTIKDHHRSGFFKKDILENYAFNLCPENGIYSGYVTEKIPESFAAGCLPVTYADEMTVIDFNPKAFINLALVLKSGIDQMPMLQSNSELSAYADERLILRRPSILPFSELMNLILKNAL